MQIGICSDKQIEIQEISRYIIQNIKFLSTDKLWFFSPEDLLVDMEFCKMRCDIMVIKTNCKAGTLDGIQIAKLILRYSPQCQIIFYSDNCRQVSDVYQVRHCYFILLEQMRKYIATAFERAEIEIQKEKHNVLMVVSDRHKVYIKNSDIIYIKRENRKTTIYTSMKAYTTYAALAKIMEQLGKNFVRCHTGYIVNLDCVEWLDNKNLQLFYGQRIPLGRAYAGNVKQCLNKEEKSFMH